LHRQKIEAKTQPEIGTPNRESRPETQPPLSTKKGDRKRTPEAGKDTETLAASDHRKERVPSEVLDHLTKKKNAGGRQVPGESQSWE